MTDINIKIGTRLRYLRFKYDLTQEDLGKAVGVTFQQIQKYEKGVNRLSIAMATDLADAMGITLLELLDISKTNLPFDRNEKQLAKYFHRIHSDKRRRMVVQFASMLSETEGVRV